MVKKYSFILFLSFLIANAAAQNDTLLLITKKSDLTKTIQLKQQTFVKCWTKNHKLKGKIEKIGNSYILLDGKKVYCSQIKELSTLSTFGKVKRIAGNCAMWSCTGPFALFMLNKNTKDYTSFEYEFETVASAKIPDTLEKNGIRQLKNDSVNYVLKNRIDSLCRNYLKFNPSKLIGCEISFAYEYKFSGAHAFEFEAGYVFPSLVHDLFAYAYANKPSFSYKGINVSAGYKTYLKNDLPDFYIESVIGYKYAGFNKQWFYTGGLDAKADYPDVLFSNFKNMVYFSVRSGSRIEKGRKVIEPYAGIGIKLACNAVHYFNFRYSYAPGTVITYDGAPPEKYQPIKHGYVLYPFISFGFKIGLNY